MASAKEFLIKLFLSADTSGGKKVDAALESISKRIDRVSAAGQKMSLFLTAPIVALGGVAVKTAADFEQTMARVGAVSNATAGEMKKLEAQALELGATTKFTASQAAEAQAFLSMAGFKPNQTLAAMPSTLQLAASAMLDIGTAADITSNILTGFAMDVSDLNHVNDVLVKGFTSSNTNLTQLGDAMKYVAPVAKASGQSIEDITAAIGALGNAGIQGSMAGTSLRGAISKLLNPSKAAARILQDLSVSTTDSSGAMRPLLDIIGDLSSAGISAAETMEIFGDRAGPGMSALIEQGSIAMKKFSAALKDSDGTAKRVAEQQQKTFKGAMEELTSAVEGLQIALAQSGLIQSLEEIVKSATNLVNSFTNSSAATKRWTIALAGTFAVAGPLLIMVGKLVGGIIGFSKMCFSAAGITAGFAKALVASGMAANVARNALIGVRIAMAALPIVGLVGTVVSLAAAFASSASAADEMTAATDRANLSAKQLSKTYGKDVTSKIWRENAEAAKGEMLTISANISKNEELVKSLESALSEKQKLNEAFKDERKKITGNNVAGIYDDEISELEKKISWTRIEIANSRAAYDSKKELWDEEKARQKEYYGQGRADIESLVTAESKLARTRRNNEQESMDAENKLGAKRVDLKNITAEIEKLESKRTDNSLPIKERIEAVNKLTSAEQERAGYVAEISKLEKAVAEEKSARNEKLKKDFAASIPQRELEILRLQAAGEKNMAREAAENLQIEKSALEIRLNSNASEKESLDIARERFELNRKIETESARKQMQSELVEARISALKRDGRTLEADTLRYRKQATEYAERFKINYADALKFVREINNLQKKQKPFDKNSDARFGKSVSQMEREQSKIQADLSSNSRARISRGQRAAAKYEDKYGMSVNDDVRDFKGFDRKTGRPIDAKVGKHSFSEKSYAVAAEQGAIYDVPTYTRAAMSTVPIASESLKDGIAATTPPKTSIASAKSFSERTESENVSNAPKSALSFSERLAMEKEKSGEPKSEKNLRGNAPLRGNKSKKKTGGGEESGDGGNIAESVASGVGSLKNIADAFKTLVDKIIDLEKNTKGSIGRLSKR